MLDKTKNHFILNNPSKWYVYFNNHEILLIKTLFFYSSNLKLQIWDFYRTIHHAYTNNRSEIESLLRNRLKWSNRIEHVHHCPTRQLCKCQFAACKTSKPISFAQRLNRITCTNTRSSHTNLGIITTYRPCSNTHTHTSWRILGSSRRTRASTACMCVRLLSD